MIFKDWTYKKKNRALLAVTLVLLLLSWYLAFGKTYRLIRGYNQLNDRMSTGNTMANTAMLRERLSTQDSLLTLYTADSTRWVSGLLVQVGEALDSYPVGVSFENKAIGTAAHIVERELILQGSFTVLQQALETLEERFFIKSIHAYVEKEQLKYKVKLAAVKTGRE